VKKLTVLLIALSLMETLLLDACKTKKDDLVVQEELGAVEHPIFSLSEAGNIYYPSFSVGASHYEYGCVIKPLKDGKITGLGLELLKAGDYTVTLWDMTTKTVITDKVITIKSDFYEEMTYQKITPISVKKGEEYLVSVNANNWFDFRDTHKDNRAILPVAIGNIEIVKFGLEESDTRVFPENFRGYHFNGVVDVEFQPIL